MSRVFVLGAGFSSCCGIPTTDFLFREAMAIGDCEKWQWERDQLHVFLRYFHPPFRPRWRNYPNIEDFLSMCDASEEFGKVILYKWYEKGLFEQVRDWLIFLLCDYLWARMEDLNEANPVTTFVEHLQPGDVVITFNWDVLLEKMCSLRAKETSYGCVGDGKVVLLKLHGSIDWIRLEEGVEPKHKEEFERLGKDLWRVKGFRNPNLSGIMDKPPFIVPPTAFKKYEQENLSQYCSQAFDALRSTDEINIIGYSLPAVDFLARSLLRQAIWNNHLVRVKDRLKITVVNPDLKVRHAYMDMVDEDVSFVQLRFEDSEFAKPHQ